MSENSQSSTHTDQKQAQPDPGPPRMDPKHREYHIVLDDKGNPVDTRKRDAPGIGGQITRAVGMTLTEMSDLDHGGTRTPFQQVVNHAMAMTNMVQTANYAAKEGFKTGMQQAQDKRARAAFIPRSDIKSPLVTENLVNDLVALSSNRKTTLDLNKRLSPETVAERATRMLAKPSIGRRQEFDLPSLGIRPSPNLIDALNNYTRGGREQLVESGLVKSMTKTEESTKDKTEQKTATNEKTKNSSRKQKSNGIGD